MIKQVDGVLLLMEEEARGVVAAYIDVEDEMQRAEVLEPEYNTQLSSVRATGGRQRAVGPHEWRKRVEADLTTWERVSKKSVPPCRANPHMIHLVLYLSTEPSG